MPLSMMKRMGGDDANISDHRPANVSAQACRPDRIQSSNVPINSRSSPSEMKSPWLGTLPKKPMRSLSAAVSAGLDA
ncbi:hypothetical protein D3C71_781810 [compost metagenome]